MQQDLSRSLSLLGKLFVHTQTSVEITEKNQILFENTEGTSCLLTKRKEYFLWQTNSNSQGQGLLELKTSIKGKGKKAFALCNDKVYSPTDWHHYQKKSYKLWI